MTHGLNRTQHWLTAVTTVISCSLPVTAPANVTLGAAPDTGLKFWLWEDRGVLLELKQRLPDQTRGFFEARGFGIKAADRAGTACIFQTMLRNTGPVESGRVEVDLTQWRVVTQDGKTPMLLRDDWNNIWKSADPPVSEASRIAFEWALLPSQQGFDPGDYNWGMTSYGLPPGSTFDLEFTWQRKGTAQHGRIDNIECPADIHPDPPSPM